jgi:hypothetical protein
MGYEENASVLGVDVFGGGGGAGHNGQHTLAVTLNYDFTTDGACSATVTKNCLQQFNIYDVTTGTPVKLFSINAPAGANGPVNGITGTSGQLSLKLGLSEIQTGGKDRY